MVSVLKDTQMLTYTSTRVHVKIVFFRTVFFYNTKWHFLITVFHWKSHDDIVFGWTLYFLDTFDEL